MDKKIEDYLHLYLGCECVTIAPDGIEHAIHENVNYYWINRSKNDGTILKPILRPLSDMSEEEMKELEKETEGEYSASQGISANIWTPKEFIYLLSKHFDLFGLIESGLAIDKTTLK